MLTIIDFVNGLFSLIFVIICLIVGIKITLRYRETNERAYLFVGGTWILIGEPWWPSSLAFLLILFTGKGLTFELYVIIGNVLLPLMGSLWCMGFTDLVAKYNKKIVLSIYIIPGIIFEIIFFYLLFTDPTQIGELKGPFDIEYKFSILWYLLYILTFYLITMILFALESFKSTDPELRLRGKFLLMAFISCYIGAVLDASVTFNIISLVLIRLLLISAAIEYYFGFMLPKFIKRIFIKEEDIAKSIL